MKNLIVIEKNEKYQFDDIKVLIERFINKDFLVYRDRYASSIRMLRKIPDEKNPYKVVKFSPVDFDKKKHGLDEVYRVTVIY